MVSISQTKGSNTGTRVYRRRQCLSGVRQLQYRGLGLPFLCRVWAELEVLRCKQHRKRPPALQPLEVAHAVQKVLCQMRSGSYQEGTLEEFPLAIETEKGHQATTPSGAEHAGALPWGTTNPCQAQGHFIDLFFFARLSKCVSAADWLIVLQKCSGKILESSVSEI